MDLIDCSGFQLDIANSSNPIIRSLFETGLARPEPLGFGLDVNEQWQVFDHDGAPSQQIFAIGPLTRGSAREVIAVPDIRNQSAEIAATLLQSRVPAFA